MFNLNPSTLLFPSGPYLEMYIGQQVVVVPQVIEVPLEVGQVKVNLFSGTFVVLL